MISIFTPTNNSEYLPEVYKSLLAQTDPDWEWVIVYNNGGVPIKFDDPRVKSNIVYRAPEWVGTLKHVACGMCAGDILLELDHDDLLMPTAIAEVKASFADPEVGFVYSNTLWATGEWTKTERFDERYGWRYREVEVNGHILDEHIAFEPTPEAVSRIWWAPNHLRAFRTSLYNEIGGYNVEMKILDDQDLMCRMYGKTKFKHIDKPLYVYRVHGKNAWLRYNAEIQENVYKLYDQYILGMAEYWASSTGLKVVNLGDKMNFEHEDSSVGVLKAYDVIQLFRDPLKTMQEISRVLAPGGWAFISVPSTDGRGAFQDPRHVSFWNENSFHYYTKGDLGKYIGSPVRFQATQLSTGEKDVNQVCWTKAHLVNLKGGYRPCGLLEI
jgi:glycosyltransferase involved in cell wall biosynthesis